MLRKLRFLILLACAVELSERNERTICCQRAAWMLKCGCVHYFFDFFQILRSTHTSIFSSQNLYLIGGFRKLTISIACLSTETVSINKKNEEGMLRCFVLYRSGQASSLTLLDKPSLSFMQSIAHITNTKIEINLLLSITKTHSII